MGQPSFIGCFDDRATSCHVTHYMSHGGRWMSRGSSGRVVIEVGATLKNRLYHVLEAQGLTLKDWFIQAAEEHIDQFEQPSLLPRERPARKDD